VLKSVWCVGNEDPFDVPGVKNSRSCRKDEGEKSEGSDEPLYEASRHTIHRTNGAAEYEDDLQSVGVNQPAE
jgi:hypothetical protein